MRIAVLAAALALAAPSARAGGPKTVDAPERPVSLVLPERPAGLDAVALDAAAPAPGGSLAADAAVVEMQTAPRSPVAAEPRTDFLAEAAAETPRSSPAAVLRRFIGLGRRDAVAKVSAALADMPAVRAYFVEAPGFGHQAATLSAVRRLRELGFKGRVQGIYHPNVQDKMGVLMPEFDAKGPAVQEIAGLGMTLESEDHFQARPDREKVPLALTGGNDLKAKERSQLAWRLGAKAFLSLQPLGWRSAPNEIFRDDASKKALPWAKKLPFIYRPARAEQLDDAYFDALKRQPSQTPAKIDGLRALTRRLGQHDLLPAYGLAFFGQDTMHRLLLGVSEAMERRPELFARKGVVIPLLLDAGVLVDPLRDGKGPSESDWSERAKGRRVKAVEAAHAKLIGKVELARIDDPDLGARLDALQAGRILVLETGPVPPAVFESLFAAATLPPSVEGKNATNLARLLGIPFLSINQDSMNDALDIGVGPVGAHFRAVMRQMAWRSYGGRRAAAVVRALGERSDDGGLVRHDFETLASFIVDALRPGSRLRGWFARRRLRLDDFRKDKIARVLKEALR